MSTEYWNFFYYQIVREHPVHFELGALDLDNEIRDEWRVYVVRAKGDDHARGLAEKHVEALNLELGVDNKEIPERKRWQLHACGRFDYSQLIKGWPMMIASFMVPMESAYDDSRSRSDINLTT